MISLSRLVMAARHLDRAPEVVHALRVFDGITPILAYIGFARIEFPQTLVLRNRLRFNLQEYYDLETLWQIYCRRIYPLYPTDRRVVDAGANVGLFSCLAAHQGCEVWAIEPFPPAFVRLQEHVALNSLVGRIACVNTALAAEAKTVYMASASATQQAHVTGSAAVAAEDRIAVRSQSLAEVMRSVSGDVDLLKVDIEGSEYEVLQSSSAEVLRNVRRIVVEYHDGRSRRQSLIAHLESCGFRVDRIMGSPDYGVVHVSKRQ